MANCVEGSHVKRGIAAAPGDLDVGERSVALHLECDPDAMTGGLRVEHVGVPLLGNLLLDLLDVVCEACAEGSILSAHADGACLGLRGAHRKVGGGGFAGLHLIGFHLTRLRMKRRGWSGLFGCFDRLGRFVGDRNSIRRWSFDGCSLEVMGAGDGVSVARTLSGLADRRGGSGISATIVAGMAPAVAPASPQPCPEWISQPNPGPARLG